jgi:hypothetical protein
MQAQQCVVRSEAVNDARAPGGADTSYSSLGRFTIYFENLELS